MRDARTVSRNGGTGRAFRDERFAAARARGRPSRPLRGARRLRPRPLPESNDTRGRARWPTASARRTGPAPPRSWPAASRARARIAGDPDWRPRREAGCQARPPLLRPREPSDVSTTCRRSPPTGRCRRASRVATGAPQRSARHSITRAIHDSGGRRTVVHVPATSRTTPAASAQGMTCLVHGARAVAGSTCRTASGTGRWRNSLRSCSSRSTSASGGPVRSHK